MPISLDQMNTTTTTTKHLYQRLTESEETAISDPNYGKIADDFFTVPVTDRIIEHLCQETDFTDITAFYVQRMLTETFNVAGRWMNDQTRANRTANVLHYAAYHQWLLQLVDRSTDQDTLYHWIDTTTVEIGFNQGRHASRDS